MPESVPNNTVNMTCVRQDVPSLHKFRAFEMIRDDSTSDASATNFFPQHLIKTLLM